MRRQQASRYLLAITTIGATLALLAPADAQFWGNPFGSPFGGRPQRQQPQPQPFNPFGGGFFDNNPQPQQREPRIQREAPVDYSRAPSAPRRPDAAAVTTPVVVLGDGMADWLAYGLEDAFSEKPEISIVRKNRAASGLIRYDTRREIEWPQVVREAITAEKPKFIVMMLGVNDRQAIRERGPGTPATPARPGAGRNAAPATAPLPLTPNASDPELQARESAEQQNAEQRNDTEQPAAAPAEPAPPANTVAGNFEFHSEKWEAAYIKRIDATIVALKSANVPVLWVGLPSQRSGRASSDSAYLNELYRGRAEKAGITYVDVWDGFVDDAGRFVVQGPDFEGQNRKLRAGDGVYFTKAGARKLAHYVEREIQRNIANRAVPVALPAPEPVAPVATAPGVRPSGASARPVAGPVVPLTISTGGGDELLGGGAVRGAQPRPVALDPIANRVLTKGETVAGPSGRADDFGWPRGAPRAVVEPAVETLPTPVAAPAVAPAPAPVTAPRPAVTAAAPLALVPEPEPASAEAKPIRKKPAPRPVVRRDPRPEPFNPFASTPGFWR